MDWQTLRNQFMRTIGGDPPGAKLEDDLITAYGEHPDAVERSFEKIALGFKAGKIRSPWGALKAEVAKATEAARNPHHDRGATREKAIARAEQQIRNELLHYDRQDEILDELFGQRGTLKQHDTPELRDRMTALYDQLRPAGIQTEQDQIERLARIKTQQEALKAALADPKVQAATEAAA